MADPPTKSAADKDDPARREALASVRDLRANFEDALKRAAAAGSKPALDVPHVLADFAAVETEIMQTPADELESLLDKAARLERLRAYVYPPEEIVLEGRSVLSDLTQWGVPASVLTTLQAELVGLLSSINLNVARGALRSLFNEYDYWAWYVDWYAAFMEKVAWTLLILEGLTLALALNRFISGDVLIGFIAAGACGALVSVISKMPPLMADAESDAYVRRIIMRVGTGLVAAVIGGGFLASGILTISLPAGRLTDIMEQCGRTASGQPGCSTGNLLILLGLGIVLGFSERMLTSLEDRIFPPAPGSPK